MKTPLRLIAFLLSLLSLTAIAGDRITATLVITNTPTAAQTLVVNSDTRTWYTAVTNLATEVLIGSTIQASTTNLWHHIARTQFGGPIVPRWVDTNSLALHGASDLAMTVLASGWATVTYSTQAVTALYTVRVPLASEPEATRTNIATLLAQGLSYSLVPIDGTKTVAYDLATVTTAQIISGNKDFTGTCTFTDISTTSLENSGNAISSRGSGLLSEQFGTDATATNMFDLAVGNQAVATGGAATALGTGATASGPLGVAIGSLAVASAQSTLAICPQAEASGMGSIAIGDSTKATHTNAIVLGPYATSTADDQITLGTSSHTTRISGDLAVSGNALLVDFDGTAGAITNGTFTGATITNATLVGSTYSGTVGALSGGYLAGTGATNFSATNVTIVATNTITGQVAFTQALHTTCASGPNAAVDFGGSTVFAVLSSGPSAVFSIAGIAGGRDGRLLLLSNQTGYTLTLSHDSGVDATPANRIYTTTGSDVDVADEGTILLIYDANSSRWRALTL